MSESNKGITILSVICSVLVVVITLNGIPVYDKLRATSDACGKNLDKIHVSNRDFLLVSSTLAVALGSHGLWKRFPWQLILLIFTIVCIASMSIVINYFLKIFELRNKDECKISQENANTLYKEEEPLFVSCIVGLCFIVISIGFAVLHQLRAPPKIATPLTNASKFQMTS